MRDDRLARLGRIGKVIIALALIAALSDSNLSLSIKVKDMEINLDMTGQ